MRSGILDLNEELRDLLSNDLGAIGGLLFDIGVSRYPVPLHTDEGNNEWRDRLDAVREEARKLSNAQLADRASDQTHSEVQMWLRDLGHALGYHVWVAANDRGRLFNGVAVFDC